MDRRVVFDDIRSERIRQELLWGSETAASIDKPDNSKMLILVEEVGEVANACLENKPVADLYEELIQVAAVAAAWAESLL